MLVTCLDHRATYRVELGYEPKQSGFRHPVLNHCTLHSSLTVMRAGTSYYVLGAVLRVNAITFPDENCSIGELKFYPSP